jgi:diacylglycerol O-acyltransferase
MEQLSGMDAGFLYMETPTLHMHTIKVAVVDPSKVPGGYCFEKFREVLAKHLHLLPPFRRRLVEAPLGLTHPVWIEDLPRVPARTASSARSSPRSPGTRSIAAGRSGRSRS